MKKQVYFRFKYLTSTACSSKPQKQENNVWPVSSLLSSSLLGILLASCMYLSACPLPRIQPTILYYYCQPGKHLSDHMVSYPIQQSPQPQKWKHQALKLTDLNETRREQRYGRQTHLILRNKPSTLSPPVLRAADTRIPTSAIHSSLWFSVASTDILDASGYYSILFGLITEMNTYLGGKQCRTWLAQ
jgi:hypothetical protein